MLTTMRCVFSTSTHSDFFFHWSGSSLPEMSPTETWMFDLMTSFCWRASATVGVRNQET